MSSVGRQFSRFLVSADSTLVISMQMIHWVISGFKDSLLTHVQSTTLIKKPNSGSITCHLYDHASSLTLHGVGKSHAQ